MRHQNDDVEVVHFFFKLGGSDQSNLGRVRPVQGFGDLTGRVNCMTNLVRPPGLGWTSPTGRVELGFMTLALTFFF